MRPRKKDKDLPPCVYLRHGAYYHVKRGKWTLLGRDVQTAMSQYGRLIGAPTGGLGRLIDEAWPYICRGVSKKTASDYQTIADKIKHMLADFEPAQVRRGDVFRMMEMLSHQPNTANRCLSVLKMVFDYACKAEIVASNPCVGIDRLTEAKRDRYITDREFLAIQSQASPLLAVVIDLCYLTAQRVSDVLGIRLEHCEEAGIAFKQGKTGTRLMVLWTPELRAVVDRAKALQGNVRTFYLLAKRNKPIPYKTLQGWWHTACEQAGVEDAHIHDIRAKSITDAKRQGHDPQALAGHASAAMTQRYIRLRETPEVQGPKGVKR